MIAMFARGCEGGYDGVGYLLKLAFYYKNDSTASHCIFEHHRVDTCLDNHLRTDFLVLECWSCLSSSDFKVGMTVDAVDSGCSELDLLRYWRR